MIQFITAPDGSTGSGMSEEYINSPGSRAESVRMNRHAGGIAFHSDAWQDHQIHRSRPLPLVWYPPKRGDAEAEAEGTVVELPNDPRKVCTRYIDVLAREDLIVVLRYNGSRLATQLNGIEVSEGQAITK